jgi:hypothetical protein
MPTIYLLTAIQRYLDVCVANANAGIEFMCLELTQNHLGGVSPGFIARGETIELWDGIIVPDYVYAETDWVASEGRYPPGAIEYVNY